MTEAQIIEALEAAIPGATARKYVPPPESFTVFQVTRDAKTAYVRVRPDDTADQVGSLCAQVAVDMATPRA